MTSTPAPAFIRFRILVMAPPPGVRFAVQRGKSELLEPLCTDADVLQFELALRLGKPLPGGATNFLGEYAQGTPADRFIYLNSGTLAGQADSPWTRRAKLKLASMPAEVVQAALLAGDGVVEARVRGGMDDGSPICASVKPQAVRWAWVHDTA